MLRNIQTDATLTSLRGPPTETALTQGWGQQYAHRSDASHSSVIKRILAQAGAYYTWELLFLSPLAYYDYYYSNEKSPFQIAHQHPYHAAHLVTANAADSVSLLNLCIVNACIILIEEYTRFYGKPFYYTVMTSYLSLHNKMAVLPGTLIVISRVQITTSGRERCLCQISKSYCGVVWLWPLTSRCQKLTVPSSPCSVDHFGQFAAKSFHSFSKYVM